MLTAARVADARRRQGKATGCTLDGEVVIDDQCQQGGASAATTTTHIVDHTDRRWMDTLNERAQLRRGSNFLYKYSPYIISQGRQIDKS